MKSKKGIKNHGERVVADMYKEYIQLEDMKVMGEMDPGSLTQSQKKVSLRSINLIKVKWNGRLKWRTCVYG